MISNSPHQNMLICPICHNQSFETFNGRPNAQCLSCGSLERTRAVYLAMKKFGIPRPNDQILHFAPENCFINLFTDSHGNNYHPCDLFPEIYKNSKKKVEFLNICEDLQSMNSNTWDLILHNHVLEHLFCSVKDVLQEFHRIMKPGGTMIFTVPVSSQPKTIEDLNPNLSEIERIEKFGQKDHVRLFGQDVIYLVKEILSIDCFVPTKTLFTKDQCETFGIPWKPEKEPDSESIFMYRKL